MPIAAAKLADRFMLWVDAVGGYWVCLAEELVVGQPGGPDGADIPILADILLTTRPNSPRRRRLRY